MTSQLPFPEEVISKIKAFSAKTHPTASMMRERIQLHGDFINEHPHREALYNMVPGAREHFYYRLAALSVRGWGGDAFNPHYYPRPNRS